MRRIALLFALVMLSATATASLRAAELDIPRRAPSGTISMQKGPPNCAHWTDECVNCTRGAAGEAPACSNIGIACQPKAIRCMAPETPAK